MRFQLYLDEEVIKISKNYIKSIVNKFDELVRNFIKKRTGKRLYYNDLDNWITTWRYANHFSGPPFFHFYVPENYEGNTYSNFILQGTGTVAGATIALSPKLLHLIKNICEEPKKYSLEDKDYQDFIKKDLPNVLIHEMIHYEQFNRGEGKINIGRKMLKKYGESDYYYHTYLEQMAHADTMIKQLKDEGYDNETIGKMLRQPKLYSEALMKSKSYRSFRNAVTDNKKWQNFMKYVYQYWQEDEE